MSATLYIAGLIAGLAGSAHCFGMCGGMAGALAMRARTASPSSMPASLHAISHHTGRIGGYAAIGALAGAFGHSVHWLMNLTRWEAALRIAAGVLTLLVGVRLLSHWNAFAPLERLGAKLWLRLQPLVRHTASHGSMTASVAIGLLWGWLPCGLVYSMVLLALTSDGALEGAGVMLAFGLGTVPAMLSTSLLAGASWLRAGPVLRRATGCALLVCGAWMIIATQLPQLHAAHAHAVLLHH